MNILWLLLITFFQIGLFSIGGGYAIIPLIQEQVVERHGWISQQVFTDIITISQMTPGPLAVNTSTFVGIQVAGITGAFLATLGCIISGVCIAVMLYCFFRRYEQSIYVYEILNGLKAASLGLILSAAATILLLAFTGSTEPSLASSVDAAAILVFFVSLFVMKRYRVNPILLMISTGILGGFIYY